MVPYHVYSSLSSFYTVKLESSRMGTPVDDEMGLSQLERIFFVRCVLMPVSCDMS